MKEFKNIKNQMKISFHKKVFIPIRQWKTSSREDISHQLRTLRPRGGTNLTCGFQKAVSEFDRVEKGEKKRRIVVGNERIERKKKEKEKKEKIRKKNREKRKKRKDKYYKMQNLYLILLFRNRK
jgi:hypothetical protein